MTEWIDTLAEAFASESFTETETERLLNATREIAHRVERKAVPLAAYLLGMDVARRVAEGARREDATIEALAALQATLPEVPPGSEGG